MKTKLKRTGVFLLVIAILVTTLSVGVYASGASALSSGPRPSTPGSSTPSTPGVVRPTTPVVSVPSGGGGASVFFLLMKNCYVTLDMNDGSEVESVKIKRNSVLDIEEPTREGYTFDGWYLDAECAQKFDTESKISNNTTLFAKWTATAQAETTEVETEAETVEVIETEEVSE